MPQCTAPATGHKTKKAAENCPACGTKQTISKGKTISKKFYQQLTRKSNINITEYMKYYNYETAPGIKEPDEELVELANYYFMQASSYVKVFKNIPDHDEPYHPRHIQKMEEKYKIMKDNNDIIDGFVTRGVTTDRYSTREELENHIKQQFPIGSQVNTGFLSTSRTPIVAQIFSSGFRRLPQITNDYNGNKTMQPAFKKKKPGNGTYQGYIMNIESPMGVTLPETKTKYYNDYNYDDGYEKEVIILPANMRVESITPAKDSVYGKPVVNLTFIENVDFDLTANAEKINNNLLSFTTKNI